jgi:hypothetical protein
MASNPIARWQNRAGPLISRAARALRSGGSTNVGSWITGPISLPKEQVTALASNEEFQNLLRPRIQRAIGPSNNLQALTEEALKSVATGKPNRYASTALKELEANPGARVVFPPNLQGLRGPGPKAMEDPAALRKFIERYANLRQDQAKAIGKQLAANKVEIAKLQQERTAIHQAQIKALRAWQAGIAPSSPTQPTQNSPLGILDTRIRELQGEQQRLANSMKALYPSGGQTTQQMTPAQAIDYALQANRISPDEAAWLRSGRIPPGRESQIVSTKLPPAGNIKAIAPALVRKGWPRAPKGRAANLTQMAAMIGIPQLIAHGLWPSD